MPLVADLVLLVEFVTVAFDFCHDMRIYPGVCQLPCASMRTPRRIACANRRLSFGDESVIGNQLLDELLLPPRQLAVRTYRSQILACPINIRTGPVFVCHVHLPPVILSLVFNAVPPIPARLLANLLKSSIFPRQNSLQKAFC